jgi:hypothetical protein
MNNGDRIAGKPALNGLYKPDLCLWRRHIRLARQNEQMTLFRTGARGEQKHKGQEAHS